MVHPRNWTRLDKGGLFVIPGAFHVDPTSRVQRAIVTHGHADHAVRGHNVVVATAETHRIMRARYGKTYCNSPIVLNIGESLTQSNVTISFFPAGHILGSVQVQIEHQGCRLGISGDYKCGGGDPSCADYEPMPCDVFLSEATFGLPVFQFPDPRLEIEKLIRSLDGLSHPHFVWAYSLGKAQRLQLMLRECGYSQSIYVHSTIDEMNAAYKAFGMDFGESIAVCKPQDIPLGKSCLVLAPRGSSLAQDSQGCSEIVRSGASGWYSVRSHALRDGVDLPLVLSDHCDWQGLLSSVESSGASELWITHGAADALKHWASSVGMEAHALVDIWKAGS